MLSTLRFSETHTMQRAVQIWGEDVMVPFLYQCPLVSYPPCSSVCLEPQRWEEMSGKQRAFRHSLQPRWQRKCHCYWMITLRAHMKHSNHHGMLKPKLNVNQVSSINTVYRNALFNCHKADTIFNHNALRESLTFKWCTLWTMKFARMQ